MWLSSAEFAAKFGMNLKSLQKICFRAKKANKKICVYKSNILVFLYSQGIGGYQGKVLKIWSEPFASEAAAEAFLRTYEQALSEGVSEVEFEAWAWRVSEAEIKARKNELERAFKADKSLKNGASEALKSDEALFKEKAHLQGFKNNEFAKGEALKSVSTRFDEGKEKTGALKSGAKGDERKTNSFAWEKRACEALEKGTLKELSCQGGCQNSTAFLLRAQHLQRDCAMRTTLRKKEALKGIEHSKSVEVRYQHPQYWQEDGLSYGKVSKAEDCEGKKGAVERKLGFGAGCVDLCEASFKDNEGLNKNNERIKSEGVSENTAKHSSKSHNLALEKLSVLKEWQRAKTQMSVKDFIALSNAKGDYSIKLSENKLFAWQRAYKNAGFEGLIDTRGGKKQNSIESLGLGEIVQKLIMASRARVNISSMHRLLHAHLAMNSLCDMRAFLAKESEVISYAVLERYVKKYLKAHPITKAIINKGEDGAVSRFLPALGVSNYKVSTINEVVEIDATSIDALIDTSSLAQSLGVEVESIEAWQKRFVLISLVDTFSGVCSFHISDTENSLGVSRAIAKYIMHYGKPKCIKSDNGSAFVSKYIKEVLLRLDIQSERTPAYSGWCKPYVERNFARLQNHLMEWLKGYIGHSVAQRQAIEFFFSRAQRRLKRGQKSNQKDLHTLGELSKIIDEYTQSFMNNAYLHRLDKTPAQAFNERVGEAVAMNEYELSSKLSPLEKRAVGKKGIAYGGLFFYSTKIYEFANVLVARNINNSNELFVYDETGKFIDIARLLDNEKGVSAEEAKRAQKHFKKKLKEEKAKMSAARKWVETQTPLVYTQLFAHLPRTKKPSYKAINDTLLESARMREEANKKVVGAEFVKELEGKGSLKQTDKVVKKDLSWEKAVLKGKK